MMEIKQKGNRYYYYSWEQMRSFPIKKSEAIEKIANGEAKLVEYFMMEAAPEVEEVVAEEVIVVEEKEVKSNVIDFQAKKEEKQQREDMKKAKEIFNQEILPYMTSAEVNGLFYADNFKEEMFRVMIRIKRTGGKILSLVPKRNKYQPRFALFMQDNQLNPGDDYKTYEYIRWIDRHSAAFKKSIGKHYLDILTPNEQDKFTDYLVEVVGE
ncbi:hypothetical protein CN978_29860 [Priestia megaterium]|uniref:hypothetical protein n=1 Tax=Priestia megaterium TaxID=1404 RepID=UPI000BFC956A|nr:hypothetical protein [Priestia megaterium]PGN53912.1 hypothetical protein CN978_29860 [Priestia megaterium]